MAKGMHHHIQSRWKRPKEFFDVVARRERMVEFRREPTFTRVEKPTRLDAARRLGYRAKPGITIVRTRVRRGGLRKGKIHMKRKPSKAGITKITMAKSIQRMAEERVGRRHPNMEVLNSYWVAQDGRHKWFEVILVDRSHPAIISDKKLSFVSEPSSKGRVFRGKTSAGKRGRGLYNKGKGAEKLRPSLKANQNRGK